MKLQYISSASVLLEHDDVRILCDPWLVDGEYFGSWAHYPPLQFNPKDFDNVDYIYISHIHPDHLSTKSLLKMNKKIPILIHTYASKFLKKNLENLGFEVRELEHNKRTKLKNNLAINILAADNCNPELCFKYFGCGLTEKNFGSTSIDTMAVIDNGDEVIVNTNDCPFTLAETSATLIKNSYQNIDMLLVGYTSASAYPQCFKMSKEEKKIAKSHLQQTYVQYAEKYVNLFKPKYFMPFAGKYTIAGKFSTLNSQKGAYELEDAYDYFLSNNNYNEQINKCIILNSGSTFDISTGNSSQDYKRINFDEKNEYIQNFLSKKKYDYEFDDEPNLEYVVSQISKSYTRFEAKRKELNFLTDTVVIISLNDDQNAVITCNGSGYKILPTRDLHKFKKYVKMSLDLKLLSWLLKGPRFASWNNAEIGSHIYYERSPDIYERGLFYCMNFFHS